MTGSGVAGRSMRKHKLSKLRVIDARSHARSLPEAAQNTGYSTCHSLNFELWQPRVCCIGCNVDAFRDAGQGAPVCRSRQRLVSQGVDTLLVCGSRSNSGNAMLVNSD